MSMKDDLKGWANVREGYWFAPKLFGWGATPVTWQGWAVCFGFVALLALNMRFVPGNVEKAIIGVALVAVLGVVSWRKTDGGWHWHWGAPKR